MSTAITPTLDVSNFNIVITVLGASTAVFGLASHLFKERLYCSDSLVALLLGIALGPLGANFFRPSDYGDIDEITLAFTRLVIGIQLILAGIQLPSLYIWKQWKSIAMLLLPIMTLKWVISAALIHFIFPLSFLEALVIGACVTPTDPVLANAIVKGRYAEKYVSAHLRNIISAEAGANDGFGYPFLFLAVYLLKIPDDGEVVKHWVLHTVLYEIAFSIVFGLICGLVARLALKYSLQRKWVDDESFFSYFLALSLFVIGSCGLLGTDDLLAAFIAGNAFSLGDFYREETADDSLQISLDMLLNQAAFVWIGATMPWDGMMLVDPGWKIFAAACSILSIGRLPAMLALYKFIPEVRSLKEATFAGWFGPMGVGAIFYVQIALPYFVDDVTYERLDLHLKPLVYGLALSSIIVHGITVPLIMTTLKIGPSIMSFTRSFSRSMTFGQEREDEVMRLPRMDDPQINRQQPQMAEQNAAVVTEQGARYNPAIRFQDQ